MAVNYRNDQLDTVSELQSIAAILLDKLVRAKQIISEAVDKGYSPGVAVTGITDALLQDTLNGSPAPFPDLSAADITAAVSAINLLDTTLAASSRAGYKALARMR